VPEIQLGIPTSLDQAPRIEWTSPAGELGTTDGSGNILIEFLVTDAGGDLVGIRLVKEDPAGATEEVYGPPFAATSEKSYSRTEPFPIGISKVTVIATDAANHTFQSTRTIQRLAVSGPGAVPGPTFTPPGGTFARFPMDVLVTSPGGVGIEVYKGKVGTNILGGTETFAGTPQTFAINGPLRLNVRVRDGSGWADWFWADYRKA
jgi:hypothetical protein